MLLQGRDEQIAKLRDALGSIDSAESGVESVRVRVRCGLLAVVHVVGCDPAIVRLVADLAEGAAEMLSIRLEQVLPVACLADAHFQVERPSPARRNRCDGEVHQPPLRRVFALVLCPTTVVPEDQRSHQAGLPRRNADADRVVRGVAAADFRPVARMT